MNPSEEVILRRLVASGLKRPKAVSLALTNQCNLSCQHCWPDSGIEHRASEIPQKQVKELIDGFLRLGAEKFIITGGEPLTHPDWFDILSFACTLPGAKEIRLQTNAVLITPTHVDALLSLKKNGLIIQTSLEGATAKAHDRVRGVGSFERTLQGLRLLIKNDMAPNICITFTEMQHNFEEIPALLKMVYDMGVRQFVTGTLVRGGRALRSRGIAPPTPAQYDNLLIRFQNDKAFKKHYNRIGNIAALEWFFDSVNTTQPCCTFIETPYVTADGRLYPCIMLHADDYAATNVYDRPLLFTLSEIIETWSRLQTIHQSRLTQIDACKGCPDYQSCGAGCMGRAYAAYGNFFSVEDRCQLRKTIYRKRNL